MFSRCILVLALLTQAAQLWLQVILVNLSPGVRLDPSLILSTWLDVLNCFSVLLLLQSVAELQEVSSRAALSWPDSIRIVVAELALQACLSTGSMRL